MSNQDENGRVELMKRIGRVLASKKNVRAGRETIHDMWSQAYPRFDNRTPEDLDAHWASIQSKERIEKTSWESWSLNCYKFQRLLDFLIDIKGTNEKERALLCFGCGTINTHAIGDIEFPDSCFVENTGSLIAFCSATCLKNHWKCRKRFIRWVQISK